MARDGDITACLEWEEKPCVNQQEHNKQKETKKIKHVTRAATCRFFVVAVISGQRKVNVAHTLEEEQSTVQFEMLLSQSMTAWLQAPLPVSEEKFQKKKKLKNDGDKKNIFQKNSFRKSHSDNKTQATKVEHGMCDKQRTTNLSM